MKGHSDIELLDAYATQRSEEAFRELVARHVDFVYSAGMRQLQNASLAQEATQSAFIALAAKAGKMPRQTVIAGWLHRAVHFAALNLQRSEARRKHWEEEAVAMNNLQGESEQVFEEVALPQVDGALAELSPPDRDAVVLHFLHQKSLRDVAQALGTTEEAAKKRVARALEKLRGLLARRGVAISAAVLAAGLSQLTVTAAPAALPSAVVGLAINGALPVEPSFETHFAPDRAKQALVVAGLILGLTAALWWLFRAPTRDRLAANPVPVQQPNAMRIKLSSVYVIDQAKALRFYTEVLGLVKKTDVVVGGGEHWLTLVSPAEPDGTQLLLEPMGFAPARKYQSILHESGIPLTSFAVESVQREYERLSSLGVVFTLAPTSAGRTAVAMFDDTCGNLIQLIELPGAGNPATTSGLRIKLNSVPVSDQEKALKFYTEILGFVKKTDLPAGTGRWLTVASAAEPDAAELLLEPTGFAPAKDYQEALRQAGIPATSFATADVQQEYERLKKLGVVFQMTPTKMGPVTLATFEDTCGNLIQIAQN